MTRRLPSLHALRVFEAAARHRSFTRAAAELCLSQGAVSQQVKLLEQDLGVALFRRLNRRLLLTEPGQELAAGVAEALDHLHRAVGRLYDREAAGVLTVTLMPSFAANWLVPRLGSFQAAWPQIDLRLHTGFDVVDLRTSDIDLAIRHGRGNYPGMHVEQLVTEEVFPVCAPRLLPALRTYDDLRRHALIKDFGVDWQVWLAAAGVRDLDTSRGPIFMDTNLALQAAIDGQGVALGRSVIAHDHLVAGRLARPFGVAVPWPETYFFVCLPEQASRPKTRAFRDWLFAEMAQCVA